MTAMNWPDHLLTLSDWDAMPEDDGFRSELVEGVLFVSPRPIVNHQRILGGLYFWLRALLPPRLSAIIEIDIVVFTEPATVRSPDLVITRSTSEIDKVKRLQAADVVVAVEILSPGTIRTDRVMKFSEYADAGIENYWIVAREPSVTLTAFRLVNGDYEKVGEYSGACALEVDGSTVTLDLDTLAFRNPPRP